MKNKNELTEKLKDYLKAIHTLEQNHKVARAKDIAALMGVHRSSVTSALKYLSQKKLIHHEPYSFVTLTQKGTSIAIKLLEHSVIG